MNTFDSNRFFYQDLGKGIVRTPESLAQEMISKIPEYIFESSTTTFLDPACGRGTFLLEITKKLKIYGHSWENITSRIFGIDIGPFSGIKQAQYILGSKNIIVQDFLEMSFPENWPKEFDVIVSNPPYSSKLDLKFLVKSVDLSSELVLFVHPSSFILDGKGVTKIYSDTREKIKNHLRSITFFNGNGIFDIGIYVPCTITFLDKKRRSEFFSFKDLQTGQVSKIGKNEIKSLSIFGYSSEFNSFSDKIRESLKESKSLGFYSNLNKSLKKLSKDCFYVEFASITAGNNRGSDLLISDKIRNDHFFAIISKHQLTVKSGLEGQKTKYDMWFEFETENEAKNFIKYLTSKFCRACLGITKINQNLHRGELKAIPWMDFTQEWTDNNLYSHFGISESEKEFIDKNISSYYD